MTNVIKQRYDGDVPRKDCYLCCAAMVAGLDYDTAMGKMDGMDATLFHTRGTLSDKECDETLGRLGFVRNVHYQVYYLLPEYVSNSFLKLLLWGRRAMLQVRSQNFRGEHHLIYWDGETLHDPSNARTYKWDGEVEPVYITLFNERYPR